MNTVTHSTLGIGFASSLFTEGQYVERVKTLIEKSMAFDPTLVLHTDGEIAQKYTSSMVVLDMLSDRMVGNSSLYKTTFPSLQNIHDDSGMVVDIGETGSTVIDPEYRRLGIGKRLILEADMRFGQNYQAIIGATVNTVMRDMRIKELEYEVVPFPSDLYEEGKTYLAPKMNGGIVEFEERAVCIAKFRVDSIRKRVIEALNY